MAAARGCAGMTGVQMRLVFDHAFLRFQRSLKQCLDTL
jgi:hypothetical protein